MAVSDAIAWRNNANNADLLLAIDSSNRLTFGGVPIPTSPSGILPVANGGTGISSYTAGDILYATGSTTLAKLNIASANYVLVSTGSAPSYALLVNANIDAAAAIDFSKLAALTSAHILVGSSLNVPTSVAVSGDISLSNTGVTAYAGTVPINKGGTGQTTKAASFDALSPTTTRGDLITRDASNNVRLALGAAGKSVRSDGTDPGWQYPIGVVQNTTTTATISQNSDVVLATTTGGSYTDTLPVAGTVGDGKRLLIQKTTSDFNVLTITDGILTTTLNTLNESVELIVAGGAWVILRRNIPSEMVGYTPTFTAFGTATAIACFWSRIGDKILLNCEFIAGVVTSSEARVSLPGALTIDNTKAGAGGTYPYGKYERNLGTANTTKTGPIIGTGSNTYINFGLDDYTTAASPLTALTGSGGFTNTNAISFYATLPITGWNG